MYYLFSMNTDNLHMKLLTVKVLTLCGVAVPRAFVCCYSIQWVQWFLAGAWGSSTTLLLKTWMSSNYMTVCFSTWCKVNCINTISFHRQDFVQLLINELLSKFVHRFIIGTCALFTYALFSLHLPQRRVMAHIGPFHIQMLLQTTIYCV